MWLLVLRFSPIKQPLGGAEDAGVGVDVEHGLRVARRDGVAQPLLEAAVVGVRGLEGGHAREGRRGLAHRREVDLGRDSIDILGMSLIAF